MGPMRKVICTALFACLGTASVLANPASSETVLWKEISGWSIRMDPSMGNACYVSSVYEDGTVLRLGFNFLNSNRSLYFSLGNAKWKSLEAGKEYPVRIQFDNNTPWDATASGLEIDAVHHLHINTHDANFAEEFSRKLSIRAFYSGRQIVALRLKGSSKAIDEMLKCQDLVSKYMNTKNQPPKNADPFAPAPSVKATDDPFDL